jgi:hypothetical protein
MNSAATEAQHKCSCGRTFRHGISLKRHQKVSGCAVTDEPIEVAAPAPIVAPEPVAPAAETFSDESGSVVITAQQIARWQEQKNARPAPAIAPAPPSISIDWTGVRATCVEFVNFTGEQFCALSRVVGWVAALGARFTLFSAFVAALGWVILVGISEDISAAPTTALDRAQAAEMAARSTVTSFLQTAQLNQFERARDFLASKTRETVSANDLRSMFSKLPLNETPQTVTSTLEQQGRVAKITVVRGGAAEVYTLVQEAQGWGLASVAVRRS